MWELEIKILALTAIYFAGWFIFEKIFVNIWNKITNKSSKKVKTNKRKVVPLASVTPMDQTWRYIRGLKNPDWKIRRISCIQLGDRRGTAVVEALIEALDDPREEVSLAAGDALVKIGDPAAIDALSRHCSRLESNSGRTYESYRAA